MSIVTEYVGMGYYQAFREDWDPGLPVGTGLGKEAAIQDLLEQEESMSILTLHGAYGRDYTSEEETKKAWASGKDFQLLEGGTYVNNQQVEDLKANGYRWLNIRYRSLSRVAVIKL